MSINPKKRKELETEAKPIARFAGFSCIQKTMVFSTTKARRLAFYGTI